MCPGRGRRWEGCMVTSFLLNWLAVFVSVCFKVWGNKGECWAEEKTVNKGGKRLREITGYCSNILYTLYNCQKSLSSYKRCYLCIISSFNKLVECAKFCPGIWSLSDSAALGGCRTFERKHLAGGSVLLVEEGWHLTAVGRSWIQPELSASWSAEAWGVPAMSSLCREPHHVFPALYCTILNREPR